MEPSEQLTPDSPRTEDLLRRHGEGDPRALDCLLDGFRDELRRLAALRMDARLRARIDPSDVVQEAQLDAVRRMAEFLQRRPMPFRLWLRKTLHERLLKLHRRHLAADKRAVGHEVHLPEESSLLLAAPFVGQVSTPSQGVARRELVRRVCEAMKRLSPADYEILLMKNHEQLSYDEICRVLEIEPAAARKRYGRALLRLRGVLAEQGLVDSRG